MNWRFCIDSTQKRALKLCRGSMDEGDGVSGAALFGGGWGYGVGDGDGCGQRRRHGDGYVDDWGNGCGCGYGLGNGDGGSPEEWE